MKQMNPSKDEHLRKKILYRSRYRGTKELDLLIGAFIKTHIESADSQFLEDLLNLLNCPDGKLHASLFNNGEIPPEAVKLFPQLLQFSKSYKGE